MARTYELYTQERSHDIAKDMAHMVERAFPLYARWKKSHKSRQHPRQENTRWHGETTKVVDEAIAQQYGKMSKSPTWAMERDIVGPQMSMIAKSYMTWYAMSAMREIRGAMREFEAENEKAGRGFVAVMLYDTKAAEATIARKRKEFGNIINELSAAIPGQQAALKSSIDEAETV